MCAEKGTVTRIINYHDEIAGGCPHAVFMLETASMALTFLLMHRCAADSAWQIKKPWYSSRPRETNRPRLLKTLLRSHLPSRAVVRKGMVSACASPHSHMRVPASPDARPHPDLTPMRSTFTPLHQLLGRTSTYSLICRITPHPLSSRRGYPQSRPSLSPSHFNLLPASRPCCSPRASRALPLPPPVPPAAHGSAPPPRSTASGPRPACRAGGGGHRRRLRVLR